MKQKKKTLKEFENNRIDGLKFINGGSGIGGDGDPGPGDDKDKEKEKEITVIVILGVPIIISK